MQIDIGALLVLSLLCLLAALISGCGGGSQSNTAASGPAQSNSPSGRATRNPRAHEVDPSIREDRAGERRLASNACEALSPAMAAAFDPRLEEQARGGSLDICSYSSPPEQPPTLQLILEFIPSPAEPSESAATAICQKLIKQIIDDSRYTTTSEAPAPLGEEAVVASTFNQDETGLVGDETTYVADWREGGSCASLIFSSQTPARPPPLSEFTDLALLVGNSG